MDNPEKLATYIAYMPTLERLKVVEGLGFATYSNSDGSNTMDGSNLFESPANFPYIFKLKKKSFTRTLIPRTVELNKWSHQ